MEKLHIALTIRLNPHSLCVKKSIAFFPTSTQNTVTLDIFLSVYTIFTFKSINFISTISLHVPHRNRKFPVLCLIQHKQTHTQSGLVSGSKRGAKPMRPLNLNIFLRSSRSHCSTEPVPAFHCTRSHYPMPTKLQMHNRDGDSPLNAAAKELRHVHHDNGNEQCCQTGLGRFYNNGSSCLARKAAINRRVPQVSLLNFTVFHYPTGPRCPEESLCVSSTGRNLHAILQG